MRMQEVYSEVGVFGSGDAGRLKWECRDFSAQKSSVSVLLFRTIIITLQRSRRNANST